MTTDNLTANVDLTALTKAVDATIDARNAAEDENFDLPTPGFDPLKKIASILVKSERAHEVGKVQLPPLNAVVKSYIAENSSIGIGSDLFNRNDVIIEDLTGILVISEATAQVGLSIPVNGTSTPLEYLTQISSNFGSKMTALLSANLPVEAIASQENQRQSKRVTEEAYELPLFEGFTPEVLIAANLLKGFVADYSDRIQCVDSKAELIKLAALSFGGQNLSVAASAKFSAAIVNPSADLDFFDFDTIC